jgi:hypothetical protein
MNNIPRHLISAILITKEKVYPERVLKQIESFGFGEILIHTECDGIYWRYLKEPKYKDVYIQDDDCIPQIDRIFAEYDGELLTCGMTPGHIAFYRNSRICLIGNGAFFPWKRIRVLEQYVNKFGKDKDYLIETDRIFTFLNFPQKRLSLSLVQLPSSFNNDRLSLRKEHYSNLNSIERKLIGFYCFSVSRHNFIFKIILYGFTVLSRLSGKLTFVKLFRSMEKQES